MNSSQKINASPVTHRQFGQGDMIGGEYQVQKVFGGAGKSGQGVVYLVTSREAHTPFVLKTIQVETKGAIYERFVREAETWVNLGLHPYIVQAYWVRRIDEQLYVAAEYIAEDEEGRNNLTHYLRDGVQTPANIERWVIQFCEGMDFAKRKGLVAHRDIKPDNIMIDAQGDVKITDFGLARVDSQIIDSIDDFSQQRRETPHSVSTLTQDNSILGTLPYMSPEQFLNSKTVDHRADIYAFGIILYEMLSGGQYPYDLNFRASDMLQEFAHAHLVAKVKAVTSPFYPIAERCLQKHPGSRYQTFLDLKKAVEEFAKYNNIPIPPSTQVRLVSDTELYAKAQSYVALGNPHKALEAIDEYISHCPENYDGWTEKGRIYLETGDPQSSIVASRESIAK